LEYIGYGLWFISIIFGIAPIIILKRKGDVAEEKSYIHTEKIVTSGLYALVRHPQYLAGILFSLSITFITQSWISLILTVVIVILTYQWTYDEDKDLTERFGDEYSQYIENVPRLNILLGIGYYILRESKQSQK
jgi:protein-S-isoprenylcysteine O-methyltransferase Ste14